jgi:hypothetical protein
MGVGTAKWENSGVVARTLASMSPPCVDETHGMPRAHASVATSPNASGHTELPAQRVGRRSSNRTWEEPGGEQLLLCSVAGEKSVGPRPRGEIRREQHLGALVNVVDTR